VSLTVTVKVQLVVFPAESVAVAVTVVEPFGNVEPEGGLQTGVVTPGQLSLTTGSAKFTTAEHFPGSASCVMFAGHVIDGG
jgi:hypothetical protein